MESLERYSDRLAAYTAGQDPLVMQAATAALLATLIAGCPAAQLRRRPQADKWSVIEILAHLAEDELSASWRYRQMLEHDGGPLGAFDQDLWARLGDYAAWDADEALALFSLLRAANLRLLNRLDAAQWRRHGVHAERGRLTVEDLARHMAGHDRNHLDQIRAHLATGGSDDGPAQGQEI